MGQAMHGARHVSSLALQLLLPQSRHPELHEACFDPEVESRVGEIPATI